MITQELTISRRGDCLFFERRFVVPDAPMGMRQSPEEKFVGPDVLQRVFAMVSDLDEREGPASREAILRIGRFMDQFLLPPETLNTLQNMEGASVLIVTDDPRIPWELSAVVGEGPAANYLAERTAVGRALATRSSGSHHPQQPSEKEEADEGKGSRALVVVDPCECLPDARREAQVLGDHLGEMGWEVEFLVGADVSPGTLFDSLNAGGWGILHLCCDVEDHETGGAIITGRGPFAAGTAMGMQLSGCVVYINGCKSGLSAPAPGAPHSFEAPVAGMAQAFLQAGAHGVIGTLWKACDKTSRIFAQTFYEALVETRILGKSLLAARQLGLRPPDDLEAATLAGFVLYGDPELHIADGVPDPPAEKTKTVTADVQTQETEEIGETEGPGEPAEEPVEIAPPPPEEIEWPNAEWFEPEAAAALQRAAAVVEGAGTLLTSIHLGWALMAEGGPLAEWLRECGYPVEMAQELAEMLVSDEHGAISDGPITEVPELSPTVQSVLAWAEAEHADHPITVAELAEQFSSDGGGIMGELLKMTGVDLSEYPSQRERPEWSSDVAEAMKSAEETAIWNEGVISSSHLLLGVFEAGGGPLTRWASQNGVDMTSAEDQFRDKLLDGAPDPTIRQTRLSLNASRIILAAEERARSAGRKELLLDDLVEAAAELEAGGFGQFLSRIGYAASSDAATRRRLDGAGGSAEMGLNFSEDAQRLLALAGRLMVAVGHGVVGTPHLICAALHAHEGLRTVVDQQGHDPDRAWMTVAQALGLPPGDDAFAERFAVGHVSLSPNLTKAAGRAHSKSADTTITSDELVCAALTQTTGMIGQVLQQVGIEPYDLAKALETGGHREDSAPNP